MRACASVLVRACARVYRVWLERLGWIFLCFVVACSSQSYRRSCHSRVNRGPPPNGFSHQRAPLIRVHVGISGQGWKALLLWFSRHAQNTSAHSRHSQLVALSAPDHHLCSACVQVRQTCSTDELCTAEYDRWHLPHPTTLFVLLSGGAYGGGGGGADDGLVPADWLEPEARRCDAGEGG